MKGEEEINQKSKTFRVNNYINAFQVRVTMNGDNLGVMPTRQALELASSHDLDLVEINASARPPVCSIMDYSKWKFDEKKKQKEQKSKQKSVQPKEIRLRPVSSDYDVAIKIEQLKKFLYERRTVFVNIKFKNRELAHKENGRKIIDKIIKAVETIAKAESPKFEGTNLSVRLIPR